MIKLVPFLCFQLLLLLFIVNAQAVICIANNSDSYCAGAAGSIGSTAVTQIFQSYQDDVEILGINASEKIILNKGDRLKYQRGSSYFFKQPQWKNLLLLTLQ